MKQTQERINSMIEEGKQLDVDVENYSIKANALKVADEANAVQAMIDAVEHTPCEALAQSLRDVKAIKYKLELNKKAQTQLKAELKKKEEADLCKQVKAIDKRAIALLRRNEEATLKLVATFKEFEAIDKELFYVAGRLKLNLGTAMGSTPECAYSHSLSIMKRVLLAAKLQGSDGHLILNGAVVKQGFQYA